MLAYISASSRGLDEDKNLYHQIIAILSESNYGLISNWVEDKNRLTAEQLFDQATADIKKSDLLIAEVTHPSTGTGQQIALALSQKIPVVLLKKSGVGSGSRFTVGTKSSYLKIINYTSNSLEKDLKKALENINKDKYIKFNFITTREINDFLEEKSEKKDISKSEFLRNIIEDWRKSNN